MGRLPRCQPAAKDAVERWHCGCGHGYRHRRRLVTRQVQRSASASAAFSTAQKLNRRTVASGVAVYPGGAGNCEGPCGVLNLWRRQWIDEVDTKHTAQVKLRIPNLFHPASHRAAEASAAASKVALGFSSSQVPAARSAPRCNTRFQAAHARTTFPKPACHLHHLLRSVPPSCPWPSVLGPQLLGTKWVQIPLRQGWADPKPLAHDSCVTVPSSRLLNRLAWSIRKQNGVGCYWIALPPFRKPLVGIMGRPILPSWGEPRTSLSTSSLLFSTNVQTLRCSPVTRPYSRECPCRPESILTRRKTPAPAALPITIVTKS